MNKGLPFTKRFGVKHIRRWHDEFFKKKKIAWFSGTLYRHGNTFCFIGSYNRMDIVLGDMPHMDRDISSKILESEDKKAKKRVSAPLITLLSVLYLILSI